MLESATLIANPVAGADAAVDRLDDLATQLGRHYVLDVVVTAQPGDAARAAESAGRRGDRRLFVAGGDGTLNEVINGLAAAPGGFANTAIGLIPMGTGNDFAAALGLPATVAEASHLAATGVAQPIDLGEVNGRRFVNVSAGGFIADVSEAVAPALKSVAGRLAYLLGGASVLLTTDPFECRSSAFTGSCLLFAVCNAPMIGGGRFIAPDARFDDGLFDVCIVEAMDLVQFVALLRRVSDGTHIDHPAVRYFRTPAITLDFDREIAVNADGEPFRTTRCEYHLQHRVVRIVAG